ncbi:MAG: hypothetical protein V1800_18430 [Candidatus Latescibacterota bacterium]
MATEQSLYRKIQLVLEVAQSVRATTLTELHKEIEERELPNFLTYQYDEVKDEFSWRQSAKVIRKTVRLCCRLGLLNSDGRHTPVGRQALRRTRYDKILGQQARLVLERHQVVLSDLNPIIQSSLQSDPPVLPTAIQLWEAVKPDVGKADFSRLLTLLSNCGAAESSQKKIYLHIVT